MLSAMITVYLSLIVLMICVWMMAMITRYPAIIDLFWAPALFQAAWVYIFILDEIDRRSFFILCLLTLWTIRITAHLYITRVRLRVHEPRYDYLVSNDRLKKMKCFLQFQLQALLIFIISTPFYWISRNIVPEFDLLDYSATITCLIGIIGEAIADWQLFTFKKQFPQKLCTEGLWYYSRHPNYFFNWLMWVGFAIYSVSSLSTGYGGVISPVILYWMMIKFSIPVSEKLSLQHKGEAYHQYQLTTPAFFPNVFKL